MDKWNSHFYLTMELNGRQKVAAAERRPVNKSYANYFASWKSREPLMEPNKATNISIKGPIMHQVDQPKPLPLADLTLTLVQ